MISEDIYLQVIDIIKKSSQKYTNFKILYEKGEITKAGEVLWGAIQNLIFAIGLIYGKKLGSHKKLKLFWKNYCIEKNMYEHFKNFEDVEKLHTNFYYEFLDIEELNELIRKAEEFYEYLNNHLKELLTEDKF